MNVSVLGHTLLRDANIGVVMSQSSNNHPIATINVNDQFEHTFPSDSRVSRALDTMAADSLAERLTGGSYFFIGNQLFDFRDGQYGGFVHTDQTIEHLSSVLGVHEIGPKNRLRVHENVTSPKYTLGKVWDAHNISIGEYGAGGAFRTDLHFGWNPFIKHINSAFQLIRLICANGMIGRTSFLNSKIPLVNRWEEHLDIASRQLQIKVDSKVTGRLSFMSRERATVRELVQLTNHVEHRLKEAHTAEEVTRLRNIQRVVNPRLHLENTYRSHVFDDRDVSSRLPGHLTVFDTFNAITEVNSHTEERGTSTARALDMMANKLMFDRKTQPIISANEETPISAFSDPTAAFFGTTTAA